jgi:predicted small lipoprotein YifL
MLNFQFSYWIGGIPIKRSFLVFISIIIITLLAGCSQSGPKVQLPAAGEVTENSTSAAPDKNENTVASESATAQNLQGSTKAAATVTDSNDNQGGANEQLLQSASADLNGDGESEQVEAIQSTVNAVADNTNEIEGRLKIRSGTSESQISFCKKSAGMSGVLSSIQFEDLDKDGSKDVFIIIPDNGAAFSYSNYFIYSYKKNKSYSFTSDNELADFISGFSFKHTSGNTLNLSNSKYSFSGNLVIEYELDQQTPDEYMSEYEQRAWIEPVAVDISEESKLALTKESYGTEEIKVPLPIFGLATVDMIGEIDLYYIVDSSFNPVLKRFEVLDFKGTEKVKAGSRNVTK